MINEVSAPDSNCINALTSGAKWELLDEDFVTDVGSPAFASVLLLQTSVPLVNGYQLTVMGKVLTVDNSLSAGTYSGSRYSGLGNSNQILAVIEAILSNCFLTEYNFVLNPIIGGNILQVVANTNQVKTDFEFSGDISNILSFGTNGADSIYSNSRIRTELLCHQEDGTLKPVLNGVKTGYVKFTNGEIKSNCFDYSKTIGIQLEGNCPDVNQGFEITQGWQKKFCIRYRLETPDENCIYQEGDWTISEPALFGRMIKQCDDDRDLARFCSFPLLGGPNPEFLNEHLKKCFCNTWSVLYFSANLNCFYGGLAAGLTYVYVVCYKIPSLGVDSVWTSTPVDGLIKIPIGDFNLEQLGFVVPNGEEYTIQVKTELRINGNPVGQVNLTNKITFTKNCNCPKVQVLWEEDCGAISAMCFDYLDETNVTTEGEKICIGRLRGGSFEDKNKRGKYSIKNKKTTQSHKLKIEKKNSRDNFKEMNDFLGSEKYWIIDKTIEGLPMTRSIIPDFGTTALYKKGELIEIIFSYSSDERLTFSNY